ncbi:hypothetical protein [Flavobacterium sp. N502540]|nr:hypothetical protein [Flavobacterium sp. N502540]
MESYLWFMVYGLWFVVYGLLFAQSCHSEERGITQETPYRMSPIFVELLL